MLSGPHGMQLSLQQVLVGNVSTSADAINIQPFEYSVFFILP